MIDHCPHAEVQTRRFILLRLLRESDTPHNPISLGEAYAAATGSHICRTMVFRAMQQCAAQGVARQDRKRRWIACPCPADVDAYLSGARVSVEQEDGPLCAVLLNVPDGCIPVTLISVADGGWTCPLPSGDLSLSDPAAKQVFLDELSLGVVESADSSATLRALRDWKGDAALTAAIQPHLLRWMDEILAVADKVSERLRAAWPVESDEAKETPPVGAASDGSRASDDHLVDGLQCERPRGSGEEPASGSGGTDASEGQALRAESSENSEGVLLVGAADQ